MNVTDLFRVMERKFAQHQHGTFDSSWSEWPPFLRDQQELTKVYRELFAGMHEKDPDSALWTAIVFESFADERVARWLATSIWVDNESWYGMSGETVAVDFHSDLDEQQLMSMTWGTCQLLGRLLEAGDITWLAVKMKQSQSMQFSYELLLPYLHQAVCYRVVQDLADTPLLKNAKDRTTWAVVSGAARLGMSRLGMEFISDDGADEMALLMKLSATHDWDELPRKRINVRDMVRGLELFEAVTG